jgi:nitrogen fixation/metabolism regulation signal transduction histidine kinase
MDYSNFRFGLIARTLLLGVFILAAVYSSLQNEWYVTSIVSFLLSIASLIEIIRYAEKYKRGLSEFLLSIKSRDFISSISLLTEKNSKSLLKEAYNTIMSEFHNIRTDKEIQYHYLRTIVEHIRIALVSFDEKGDIQFINKPAIELLNIKHKRNIGHIKNQDNNLYNLIVKLKSGESELIKIKLGEDLMHLSVYATELKIQNKNIKLISLQNIKQELEYQELESWQKLIRVLTHEIMNSVTPISSLSNAINDTLEETKGQKSELQKISDEDFEDIISSLKTIESRSKGLLKFVSSYKQLTRLPKPDFKEVDLVELLNHCHTLLKQKISERKINFLFKNTSESITTQADYDQIEQVVINLLINAIDAVKEQDKPLIKVEIIRSDLNKHKIIFKDNGKGIDSVELDKIFIPFYTTKKEGSGIGLSLSRQIMRLHKGSIQVKSELGKGAEVILKF